MSTNEVIITRFDVRLPRSQGKWRALEQSAWRLASLSNALSLESVQGRALMQRAYLGVCAEVVSRMGQIPAWQRPNALDFVESTLTMFTPTSDENPHG